MKIFCLRKFSSAVVVLIAVTVLVWGISPPATVEAGKKPVKIGQLSPFSPPGDAAAGKRMRWGAELAIQYINEEMGGVLDGRPVELVVEDDSANTDCFFGPA